MFLRDLIRGFSPNNGPAMPAASGSRPAGTWPLDRSLVELAPGDSLTVRDCVSGIQIFGATGSGKTSGSIALLAQAMLRDGWGILVMTTRPGEAEQWVRWATANGRAGDVLRIGADGRHRFNFLNYLSDHPEPGVRVASNIGDMLMNLAKHARPQEKASEASQFFAEAASRMVTQAIHVLRAAGVSLTLTAINDVIRQAPNDLKRKDEPDFANSLLPRLLDQAYHNGAPNCRELCGYWLQEYPGMNERTRGDVVSTLASVVHRFAEPPIRDLIASEDGNSFIPEMVDVGRIMILDCPVVTYQQAGRLFQIAIKHLTQQAILRRPALDTTRPVAIFADEAQNFATQFDYAYQAICRDHRGCTVYATQSIDNYRQAVGSDASVEALLASLVVKIFHANGGKTNEWAEKLIAGDWRVMPSESLNQRGEEARPSVGFSQSEAVQPQVLASEFTRMRTGGTRHGGVVDGIVFQPGRLFRQTGKPMLRVAFAQGHRPS